MILWSFLIGMTLCALTLALIRAEDGQETDKFANAVAMFCGWCAFGMLLMAGTYGLGLLLPAVAAAVVLTLRLTNLGRHLFMLAPYKIALGTAALICSVAAWVGVLNMMEEIPNG